MVAGRERATRCLSVCWGLDRIPRVRCTTGDPSGCARSGALGTIPRVERSAGASHQTFVFADLAGYTALTEAHGDERAADVAASFSGEVRALLGDYNAHEVKSIGDALMLHTSDAREALHLAARLAGEFGSRHHSLGVRVGMHTGTAVERDGDWFGGAVNLAARVAAAAGPGEVLLTSATAAAANAEQGELELTPRGRRRFRNVAEPVEVFALTPRGEAVSGPLPVDPVCRMAVDPQRARQQLVHRGVEYHFCSEQCAAAFSSHPERYARAVSRRAPGHRRRSALPYVIYRWATRPLRRIARRLFRRSST